MHVPGVLVLMCAARLDQSHRGGWNGLFWPSLIKSPPAAIPEHMEMRWGAGLAMGRAGAGGWVPCFSFTPLSPRALLITPGN